MKEELGFEIQTSSRISKNHGEKKVRVSQGVTDLISRLLGVSLLI